MDYLKQNEKVRIFVVDDEEIISSTIAAILRLKGFEAIPFTIPLQALAAARLQTPDLLISDMVMPLLSGFELARQMQQLHPTCEVLLFSGEWDTVRSVHNVQGDKNGFEMIPKPVHPKELLKKVQEMLNGRPMLGTGEDRARALLAKNMQETLATVHADIAVSAAHKRVTTKRTDRNGGK